MVYSQDEKQRLDRLLDAFRGYLEYRTDFDVVFSEKVGFVRLITEPGSDAVWFPIGGYDDLLEMFILDHLQDEEDRTENGIEMDLCRVRERLLPLLHSLGPDADYALRVMELCLSIWQCSNHASAQRHLTLLPRKTPNR